MANLDRFAHGLPDPQEAKITGHCDNCGGELYEGEEEMYCVECDELFERMDDCPEPEMCEYCGKLTERVPCERCGRGLPFDEEEGES